MKFKVKYSGMGPYGVYDIYVSSSIPLLKETYFLIWRPSVNSFDWVKASDCVVVN